MWFVIAMLVFGLSFILHPYWKTEEYGRSEKSGSIVVGIGLALVGTMDLWNLEDSVLANAVLTIILVIALAIYANNVGWKDE